MKKKAPAKPKTTRKRKSASVLDLLLDQDNSFVVNSHTFNNATLWIKADQILAIEEIHPEFPLHDGTGLFYDALLYVKGREKPFPIFKSSFEGAKNV